MPSTHPPNYEVDPAVQLVPINELARVERPWQRYTIIGAGKTGLDALLFLLAQVWTEIQLIADGFWMFVFLFRVSSLPTSNGFALMMYGTSTGTTLSRMEECRWENSISMAVCWVDLQFQPPSEKIRLLNGFGLKFFQTTNVSFFPFQNETISPFFTVFSHGGFA